jgi:non-lysosomal glucosylceramidase
MAKKTIAVIFILAVACSGLKAAAQNSRPAEEAKGPEAAVKAELSARYAGLLAEKGIIDDLGVEIDGRLAALLKEAAAAGRAKKEALLRRVLDRLGYEKGNLAGFPACAFDRPFGTKLVNYGRTAAVATNEATAEASACPVGGIGAGGFERTMSGNFRTWFLKLGWMVDDTVWADQFHVFMKAGAKTVVQTLSADSAPAGALGKWAWRLPEGSGTYYALFPKSGFSYERQADWPVKLAVVQFSPVIPGNYRETSLPVAVYRWIAENPGPRRAEVSILLTWENMVGWEAVSSDPGQPNLFVWDKRSQGQTNEFVSEGGKKGVIFRRRGEDVRFGNAMTGTMAIAALETPNRTKVHYQATFDPRGDGGDVFTRFAADGTLPDSEASRTASPGERLAAGLAVKFVLEPGQRLEVPFAVAWDFPFYEFEKGVKVRKKYTQFFGADGGAAFRIAAEALDKYHAWEKEIDDWQRTIVADAKLADWFKQALLNELYVLVETSIWEAETDRHTYLESVDYLMYGTFDVDSYCWHTLKLWPELELNHLRYFAGTVDQADPWTKLYQYSVVSPREVPADKLSYYWSPNKVPGMFPHDIGSPRVRPWVVLNAFDWQNGNVWKDLNSKFPLRAYRDFLAGGGMDLAFLKAAFQASVRGLHTLAERFGDPTSHLPLNEGIPDQTYDTWRMKGESAYVGLLWLAALRATDAMAADLLGRGVGRLGELDVAAVREKYRTWFAAGRAALEKLWDDARGYFHIDATTDDVMADQLFGVWYAAMLGLGDEAGAPLIPLERTRRTLATIYKTNVLGFGGGRLGAVNGRRADGGQLLNQQGDEVWVGTAYAFAANCILHGLREEGLHTAYGLYHVIYSPYGQGYFFKTPEAYLNPDEAVWDNPTVKYGRKLFRAMKYMRPGAVWAVYEALKKQ